jgi:hypothetical protein
MCSMLEHSKSRSRSQNRNRASKIPINVPLRIAKNSTGYGLKLLAREKIEGIQRTSSVQSFKPQAYYPRATIGPGESMENRIVSANDNLGYGKTRS